MLLTLFRVFNNFTINKKVTVLRGDWEFIFLKKYGFTVRICVFAGIFYTHGLKLYVGKISRAKYVAPYSRALSKINNNNHTPLSKPTYPIITIAMYMTQ